MILDNTQQAIAEDPTDITKWDLYDQLYAKQQPVNSAGRRAAIQEAERFLNERKGKLRPDEEKQIREARRELDS